MDFHLTVVSLAYQLFNEGHVPIAVKSAKNPQHHILILREPYEMAENYKFLVKI